MKSKYKIQSHLKSAVASFYNGFRKKYVNWNESFRRCLNNITTTFNN